jgi:hypothetical protein
VDRVVNPRWNYHSAYKRVYGKRVYVATDEPSVWTDMLRYPQYEMLRGDGADHGRYSAEGFDAFLTEAFTLAGASYFVGTLSSGVSRLVYELMYSRFGPEAYNRTWSLDDPWFGDVYNKGFKYDMVYAPEWPLKLK